MASQQQIDKLKKSISNWQRIDREKLKRRDYGPLALTNFLDEVETELIPIIKVVENNCNKISDGVLGNVTGHLNTLVSQYNSQSSQNETQYGARLNEFKTAIMNTVEQLWEFLPQFLSVVILKEMITEHGDFRLNLVKSIEKIEAVKSDATKQLQDASAELIERAKEEAAQIEENARATAARVSFKEAQEEFQSAADELQGKIIGYYWLSAFFFAAFIVLAGWFLFNHKPPSDIGWSVIYYTTIRIVILGAVGGVLAFCLKMLRANLHMREINLHRRRLANSMQTFAHAALTKEQRDIILMRVVEAIADFGNSGLLSRSSGDEAGAFYRMPIQFMSNIKKES